MLLLLGSLAIILVGLLTLVLWILFTPSEDPGWDKGQRLSKGGKR